MAANFHRLTCGKIFGSRIHFSLYIIQPIELKRMGEFPTEDQNNIGLV